MTKTIWAILLGIMGVKLFFDGVDYLPVLFFAVGYLMLND